MHLFSLRARAVFKYFVVVLSLSGIAASADDLTRFVPKQPPSTNPGKNIQPVVSTPTMADDHAVMVKKLNALVFVSNSKAIVSNGLPGTEGIQVRDIPFLNNADFRKQIAPFLGLPVSGFAINGVQRAVIAYYTKHDRPIVNIDVPEQDITNGVVQMIVREGVLGKVFVKGNHWFSTNLLRSQVRVDQGSVIYKSRLDQNIDLMNRNPFLSAQASLTPGGAPGTTDIIIEEKDQFPLRVYAGFDNDGTVGTSPNELLAGFNYGNLFGAGQQLGYQYTTSADLDTVRTHSFNYLAPLPWGHILNVYGIYSETHPVLGPNFDQSGNAAQISPRYQIPLTTFGHFSQDCGLGYDYKSTNNDLLFGGTQVFNDTAAVSQFVLSYDATLLDNWGTTAFQIDGFFSPGGMTANNQNANFQQQRMGATANYIYTRFHLDRTTRLPAEVSFLSNFTFQFSDTPLIGSEQLVVGGSDSVRGFYQSSASGDQGFISDQELRSPALHPAAYFGAPALNDNLQFFAFWDYGLSELEQPIPGYTNYEHLSSIGLGFHYMIDKYLAGRIDYALPVITPQLPQACIQRFQVSVTVSY